ncbi:MAG: sigma-70 family RNA polymerase sigma factor [Sphingobacteriia bacterium]|jgi:RNA polymerase sigma-70 factor (ECF subfamily)
MSFNAEISALKKGSEKAFSEVYHQTYDKLFKYFLKKTKEKSIAIELSQTTFIKLWRFKHTLSVEISLDKQLFIIARGCFIDHVRQQSGYRSNFIHYNEQSPNFINTQIINTHSFEQDDYFKTAVNTLPPARKKVFLLSRVNGLSNKEIAETLTISVNTVEDHITKAIRHIKSLISILLLIGIADHW